MVKLKGPLGSAEASGTLGRTAIFSSWKGRAYAKAHAIPSDPNSSLQISVRQMLGFLASQFKAFTAPNKATWEELAAQTNIPPYNAFLSTNLNRWKMFHAPSKSYPAAETGTQPEPDTLSTIGGIGHIHFSAEWIDLNNAWGMIIFHLAFPAQPTSRANALHILPLTKLSGQIWTWSTNVIGTHYFNYRTFTTAGKLSAALGYTTAVVT